MSRRTRGVAALGGLAAVGIAAGILLATSPWDDDEPEPAAGQRTTIAEQPTATEPAATEPAAESPSTTLRVMTFNIFYGGDELDLSTGDWCTRPAGCQDAFDQVVAAIEAADADIVGLQETTMNTRTLAERLGWHASERTHVISRVPILDPAGADGDYVLVEPEPGRVVAVANLHLPSSPYGPYRIRKGAELDEVIALEERRRVRALERHLAPLEGLIARGMPVFITGDFNTPSHLDWTAAADRARREIRYPVEWPVSTTLVDAGFEDSYRAVHPDPVERAGFTWTPGGPESVKKEVHDRIDWVLSAGPAEATESSVLGEAGNDDVVDLEVDPWPSDHRAVVSKFRVTPAEMPPLVSVESRIVERGEPVDVRFHRSRADDYVSIATAATLGAPRPESDDAGDALDGTLRFSTDDLQPGQQDVVLISGDGEILAAAQFWLYEPGSEPTVQTAKRSYTVGEPIEVAWSKAPGMKYDWLSVFKARDKPLPPQENCSAGTCGNWRYLIYEYTDARVEGATTFDAGSLAGYASWPLEPGEYEIRLLLDDGYRSIATSQPFRVTEP